MIVIDLETTGADYKNCSILSIGAVDFSNPSNTFYGECRAREGTFIDPKALEVCGFTLDQMKNNPKPCGELLNEFAEWCKNINDFTIAGHNVQFDFNFLIENFSIYNIKWIFNIRTVDLHSIFYFYMLKNKMNIPLKNNASALSLDKILEYINLKRKGRTHNALEDAELTCKAFSAIIKK